MRTALFALALVLAVAGSAPAADEDAGVVVKKWLVIAPVDVVARRTLRPDAVFAKYLLDRASAPPKEGEEITGTLGKPAKWAWRETDKDGDVEAENGAWAYASVELPKRRVFLAKLEGAGVLYVNGAGFPGDVYRLGDAGVPVALREGANDVYVAGPRGGFRLTFTLAYPGKPESRIDHSSIDKISDWTRSVVPDRVEGAPGEDLPSSYRELNAGLAAWPGLVPLGVSMRRPSDPSKVQRRLVKPGEPYRRTFISGIDGSVQSYAVVPPAPSDIDKTKMGLVLSLHGAGVECMNQAKAYAPKPDFWIVCPTNRGNYGFDWQDWGRLDAYEVLEDALKVTGLDPRRVYLTGHSMGGHGTWHLAANDPGRFLAIAPSAGWSSFESINGPQTSPLAWMWRAADGASRTLDLVGNLAQIPTYVLHGEKDDNIPASEAHLMIDAITKAGGHPESHFEPDAGHWWDKDKAPGADCVDWPGIWELFRKTQPEEGHSAEPSWTETDPPTAKPSRWVFIEQPMEYSRPGRVNARWDAARRVATATTENVRRLTMLLHPFAKADEAPAPAEVRIDGTRLAVNELRTCDFVRADGRWKLEEWSNDELVELWQRREKWIGQSGPFKRAFDNRFVLVYGTAGDDSENRELIEKARYDSEVWAYRANGDANLMSDVDFLTGDFKGRNVIVYGNADTNRAWSAVFDDDCPIVAKRGTITVGRAKHEGVVAAAFVRPRKGSTVALAAAFADTGAAATRLFYDFPVFSSGVGIPDYVVFGPGFLKEMDGDVRAAGWFDYAWRLR